MDPFLNLLKEINIAQIFVIFFGIWIFYNRLHSKIDEQRHDILRVEQKLTQDILRVEQKLTQDILRVEQKLTQDIQKLVTQDIQRLEQKLTQDIQRVEQKLTLDIDRLGEKIEKLDGKVEDIDRRLCRIEGSLATHGHCLFNQAKPEQKAL